MGLEITAAGEEILGQTLREAEEIRRLRAAEEAAARLRAGLVDTPETLAAVNARVRARIAATPLESPPPKTRGYVRPYPWGSQ